MDVATDIDLPVEFTESSIKVHEFSASLIGQDVTFLILKLQQSLFIWIGSSRDKSFNDLSLALQSNFDKLISCSHLFGTSSEISRSLSIKLAKKLGKPVYLSYNLSDNQFTIEVMKRLLEEIKNNSEFF